MQFYYMVLLYIIFKDLLPWMVRFGGIITYRCSTCKVIYNICIIRTIFRSRVGFFSSKLTSKSFYVRSVLLLFNFLSPSTKGGRLKPARTGTCVAGGSRRRKG